ncbi:hypothetical protein KHA80_18990 [Anaerobacillus sp. HL2]|nr:hypothetical protein KHA80_18990 [Anaerobacillus sp. HL2]
MLTYGYLVTDNIGFEKGQQLDIDLLKSVSLRPYQNDAVKHFHGHKEKNEAEVEL